MSILLSVRHQVLADMMSADEDAAPAKQLHFPAFHSEVLTQIWANPAQHMGTIKVAIAEGICQGGETAGFVKLRNLVTFSFQHAPLRKVYLCP